MARDRNTSFRKVVGSRIMSKYYPSLDNYYSIAQMKEEMGMVIPVWFPDEVPQDRIRLILATTLKDCEVYVSPKLIKVVIDGCDRCLEIAEKLREEMAPFEVMYSAENRGKGAAVLDGMKVLLEDERVGFVAVRDADGDHFINDLLNLFRISKQIERENEDVPSVVIGRRSELHRPLGFQRGEYELIINKLVLDGIKFKLAGRGVVLDTRYAAVYADVPDFQSGYKLYNLSAVKYIVAALSTREASSADFDILRYGPEIAPIVEVALQGGIIGEVKRIGYDEQPVTTYGEGKRAYKFGCKAGWLFKRLGLSPSQAEAFMDNTVSRCLLFKEAGGKDELKEFRRISLRLLGGSPSADDYLPVPVYC